MHVTLFLTSPDKSSIRLPSANLHLFQSMLYSVLPFYSDKLADIVHDEGFVSDGRKMKLFAMSWPAAASSPQFGENTVIFPLPIKLVISTPLNSLAAGFSEGALSAGKLRIGNNVVFCSKVETVRHLIISEKITITTLSPITCYETIERDGRNYTKYFSPQDEEFQKSIYSNLVRKFKLLHPNENKSNWKFSITPLGKVKEKVSLFEKGGSFPIKGWWGNFKIEGSEELLQTALDCGLGSKNSAGWGCITDIKERNH